METFFDRLHFLINKETGGKHTKFAKKAGIPVSTFQSYLSDRMPIAEHLIRISETFKVSLDWILTGVGSPYIKDQGEAPDEDSEVAELLEMTRQIVKSDTSYGLSLVANIRSFHQAMIAEQRYQDLEKRMSRLESVRGAPDSLDRRRKERSQKENPAGIPEKTDRRSGTERRVAGKKG